MSPDFFFSFLVCVAVWCATPAARTVDSWEDACRLSAAGVTTVISNVPMVLQQQLRSFQAIS